MAVNFKGGFVDRKGKPLDCEPVDCEPSYIHDHPLSTDEIRFLLTILKKSTFTGDEMENLIIITMKLQEEYKTVSDNEEKNK